MKIYLTRHGETVWNLEKRFQGWGDSELTDKGILRAKLLGERLKNIQIDKIYTSPIKRAYRTAEIIKGNRDIELISIDGIKEMNFGKWEGLRNYDIKQNPEYAPHLYNLFNNPKDYKTFGGESPKEFKKRIFNSMSEIIKNTNNNESILIVTHGMTVKYLITYFSKEFTEDKFTDLPIFKQASYTEINYDGSTFEIIKLNDIEHYNLNKVI
ncbi:histidine phosphatase family protein [Clostridium tarantellae]|uniref:Histidine phosphatase family protein n=1 Tax=Clostridium tarantellae TaxID=39493 RepID=A0A6I1MJK0_9CLOT|nr:histidine phosphatase family protein [Clostridium tarantellae]MPQ43270.1 histidine phosphatase family protein [Clostridium tarantellae]